MITDNKIRKFVVRYSPDDDNWGSNDDFVVVQVDLEEILKLKKIVEPLFKEHTFYCASFTYDYLFEPTHSRELIRNSIINETDDIDSHTNLIQDHEFEVNLDVSLAALRIKSSGIMWHFYDDNNDSYETCTITWEELEKIQFTEAIEWCKPEGDHDLLKATLFMSYENGIVNLDNVIGGDDIPDDVIESYRKDAENLLRGNKKKSRKKKG